MNMLWFKIFCCILLKDKPPSQSVVLPSLQLPSSHQLWPAPLYMLRKSSSTASCCHNSIIHCEWYFIMDKQYWLLFLVKHSISLVVYKVKFRSQMKRAPYPINVLCVILPCSKIVHKFSLRNLWGLYKTASLFKPMRWLYYSQWMYWIFSGV